MQVLYGQDFSSLLVSNAGCGPPKHAEATSLQDWWLSFEVLCFREQFLQSPTGDWNLQGQSTNLLPFQHDTTNQVPGDPKETGWKKERLRTLKVHDNKEQSRTTSAGQDTTVLLEEKNIYRKN